VDLKDSLNQKQEIVLVSDPLLKEAATTQNKITNINEIIKNQQQLEGMMDYFLSTFPDKLKLTKLDLDETQINFEGLTDDPNVVKAYYNNLKKEGKFGTTQLLKLNKTQDGFSFNFVLGNYKMSKAS
jgi:Tfp pilus assembly protein PilN